MKSPLFLALVIPDLGRDRYDGQRDSAIAS
jgi:hypothetical protein